MTNPAHSQIPGSNTQIQIHNRLTGLNTINAKLFSKLVCKCYQHTNNIPGGHTNKNAFQVTQKSFATCKEHKEISAINFCMFHFFVQTTFMHANAHNEQQQTQHATNIK